MLHVIKSLPPGFEHVSMIDTLCEDFLPNRRLPTSEEIHRTFSNPQEADPRLVAYCYFRQRMVRWVNNLENKIRDVIEQDLEGEEWKYK